MVTGRGYPWNAYREHVDAEVILCMSLLDFCHFLSPLIYCLCLWAIYHWISSRSLATTWKKCLRNLIQKCSPVGICESRINSRRAFDLSERLTRRCARCIRGHITVLEWKHLGKIANLWRLPSPSPPSTWLLMPINILSGECLYFLTSLYPLSLWKQWFSSTSLSPWPKNVLMSQTVCLACDIRFKGFEGWVLRCQQQVLL